MIGLGVIDVGERVPRWETVVTIIVFQKLKKTSLTVAASFAELLNST